MSGKEERVLDNLFTLLGVRKELKRNFVMVNQVVGTSGAPWRDSERWLKLTNRASRMEQVALENTNTCTGQFGARENKSIQQRHANRCGKVTQIEVTSGQRSREVSIKHETTVSSKDRG